MRSYSYVLIWMSISISVILFNKWLLAFSGFPYPIALTSWHMLFCSVVGFLCVRVFKVVKSHNMTAHTYVRRVLPIGASFAFFRATPARRHSTQHAASHWPAAMAHSARTHRRAASSASLMHWLNPIRQRRVMIVFCWRRIPVRSQPLAVQRVVPVSLGVVHPNDKVAHAGAGVRIRRAAGH